MVVLILASTQTHEQLLSRTHSNVGTALQALRAVSTFEFPDLGLQHNHDRVEFGGTWIRLCISQQYE